MNILIHVIGEWSKNQSAPFLCACRQAKRCAAIAVLAGAVLAGGCHSPSRGRDMPPWTSQPKGNDSVYVYVVGNALSRVSSSAAREAAYQDALRQLALQVAPDAQAGRLRGVEILPGCVYFEEHDGRFDCWVQVSWPVEEKNKLIEQGERRPPTP